MKTDMIYLGKVKEIRDAAQGAKKTTQPLTTWAGPGTTLKKRKHPIALRGPFEHLAPEMAPVPSAPVAILVINLEEDAEGPSPPVNGAPAKTLQLEIPPFISLAPIVKTPAPIAPLALSTTTEAPSTVVASTSTPD